MFKNIIKYFMQKFSKFERFVRTIQRINKQIKALIYKQPVLSERDILQAINVANVHNKTFSPFKNRHFGENIAIIATGPSLNKYKPLDNVITIGLNREVFYDKVNFDYFFMQDYMAVKDYINELSNERFKNTVKFFGMAPEAYFDSKRALAPYIIPEQLVLKYGARQYFQHCKEFLPPKFYKDIDCNYIECGGSVVFAAVQFALYTNPKKIYLVGCDCSSGYFDEKNPIIKPNKNLVKSWEELKKFAEIYYPETEIISVNPVGLKGVFKDWYQEDSRLG